MSRFDKNMITVLGLSTAVMVFNMFAVVSGIADPIYSQVSELLARI